MNKKALLQWYIDAGVDEAIDDAPRDYFATMPQPVPAATMPGQPAAQTPAVRGPAPLRHSTLAAAEAARAAADACTTLAQLEAAVQGFDGCALKRTANKTVFADGNPAARVMLIGEAPSSNDDVEGRAFCGPYGELLDKMLAAIGLDRTSVYLTNSIFWRPPGNRQPSADELSICLPFTEKHIALVQPKILILAGGTATTALLRKDQSISRLRGKFYEYGNGYMPSAVPTLLMYTPAHLIRTPSHKRLAWQDLLMLKTFLEKNA